VTTDPLPHPALSLSGIAKVYRLYRRPIYRVLDLLGVCPAGEAFFSEHAALDGIDLSIGRGEKVAIIGRNGAGKSTLLKIITQVIRPSAGTMDVRGKISALLQIGTGFHPDFTGRQNAYSGMAHQGITGRTADQKFEEIVEFSELDEFIDQPMKTYSTGMCARLMFSASIVLEPDILVVDEVLGVGDAYFTHKSFNRMRDLCKGHGTTLLLVTHDIYSAMNLCDRFIWIDKGKVMFDGDAKSAIGRYEASIKQQEEERLRNRSVRVLDKSAPAAASRVHVMVRSRTGFALPAPLGLARLEISYDGGDRLALDVAEGDEAWSLMAQGNLGPPREIEGTMARALEVTGSIYHKAEWAVSLPKMEGLKELNIVWNYAGDESAELRVFTSEKQLLVKEDLGRTIGWESRSFSLRKAVAKELDAGNQAEFGTGAVRMKSISLLGRDEEPVSKVRHGDHLKVRVQFEVADALKERAATFVVGFNRPGFPFGGYACVDRIEFASGQRQFTLDAILDPLLLGSGDWMITVGFGEPQLYHGRDLDYFTVSDKWYHFISRGMQLQVESVSMLDASGCFMVHPAAFRLKSEESTQKTIQSFVPEAQTTA
jgi:lipopolysaccharide transport system ATP-binding protein